MSVDEPITVRVAGKTLDKAISRDDRAALERVSRAVIVASRLAYTARARFRAGRHASPSRPYAYKRPYIISQGYAQAIGLSRRAYRDSAEFHQIARGTKGNITGGMLRGLRVRNYGIKGAVVEFAGTSLGSKIRARKIGGANQNVSVANRKKAQQVWRRLRLNPIQPTDGEITGLGSATTMVLADDVMNAMSATRKTRQAGGNVLIARQLVADLTRGSQIRLMGS